MPLSVEEVSLNEEVVINGRSLNVSIVSYTILAVKTQQNYHLSCGMKKKRKTTVRIKHSTSSSIGRGLSFPCCQKSFEPGRVHINYTNGSDV